MLRKHASHFFKDDEILSAAIGPVLAGMMLLFSATPFYRRKGGIEDWNVSTTHLLPLLLI